MLNELISKIEVRTMMLFINYFKYDLEFYQSQDIKQIQEDLLSKDLDMIPFLPINLAPYNDSMLQWNIGR